MFAWRLAGAKGVALLDYAGHLRATEDILADIQRNWPSGMPEPK